MESIWRKTCRIEPRGSLSGNTETDTVVIGGGITGILTAWQLKQKGADAVVLEAERLCSGETEGTTGKLCAHHGYICSFLLNRYGRAAGREYIKANLDSLDEYERIVNEKRIDCDYVKSADLLYSKASPDKIEKEARASRILGLECEIVKPALPFHTVGAVKCDGQAMFNPLKFLSALASEITAYEHSRVTRVEANAVYTDKGKVTAKNIVFASHMPFVNFPGLYFARMYLERSYVITVESDFHTEDMLIGIEDGTLSLRPYGKYMLAGGGAHRCGSFRRRAGYSAIKHDLDKYFGNYREIARQSAQDCIPAGRVPLIGRFAPSRPNWYVAAGYQKWGMTSAMTAAMYISDMISGISEHKSSVFSPSFPSKNRVSELAKNVGWSVKGLSKEYLTLPSETTDSIKRGSAAIVKYKGKKHGVYRDDSGALHAVSVKCPHLGCQLEWNPDEKSWDCPCHGSRFDYTGKILSGPSLKQLKKAK